MIEIVEKMAVNNRIITSVPGKKNWMKLSPPGRSGALKERFMPAPMKTQKTMGVTRAPMIRLHRAGIGPVRLAK